MTPAERESVKPVLQAKLNSGRTTQPTDAEASKLAEYGIVPTGMKKLKKLKKLEGLKSLGEQ